MAAAQSVVVGCTPSAIGIRTAILTLTTDDPTQPTVSFALVCTGDAAPSPALSNLQNIAGLDGAYGVAASPDGAQIYVSNFYSGTLSQFNHNPSDGKLTLAQSYSGANLAGARKIAVSPDGTQVYVTASTASALTIFERDKTNGALTQKTVHTNNAIVRG
ncbi:MAG: beta-propeller fold lactonase family protein [Caldilineaceae bacterium]